MIFFRNGIIDYLIQGCRNKEEKETLLKSVAKTNDLTEEEKFYLIKISLKENERNI